MRELLRKDLFVANEGLFEVGFLCRAGDFLSVSRIDSQVCLSWTFDEHKDEFKSWTNEDDLPDIGCLEGLSITDNRLGLCLDWLDIVL